VSHFDAGTVTNFIGADRNAGYIAAASQPRLPAAGETGIGKRPEPALFGDNTG
jgi:hypothetical protein